MFGRPFYHTNQVLTQSLLEGEQAHRLLRRLRHMYGMHGVASRIGLTLHMEDASTVTIDPGVAIDDEGRELHLPRKIEEKLPPHQAGATYTVLLLQEAASDAAQVALVPDAKSQGGAKSPADPFATSPTEPTGGQRDDTARVSLGRLRAEVEGRWQIQMKDPADASRLRGQSIRAPHGNAMLSFGAEEDDDIPPFQFQTDAGPAALSMDLEGRVFAQAGMLHESGGEPFCIDRLTLEEDECDKDADNGGFWFLGTGPGGADGPKALSFRSPDDGGAPACNLVIGKRAEGGTFQPLLRISKESGITVEGDLIVSGKIGYETPAPHPDDPKLVADLMKAWREGGESVRSRAVGGINAELSGFSEAIGTGQLSGWLTIRNNSAERIDDIAVLLTVYTAETVRQQWLPIESAKGAKFSLNPGKEKHQAVLLTNMASHSSKSPSIQLAVKVIGKGPRGVPVSYTDVAAVGISTTVREKTASAEESTAARATIPEDRK